MSKPAARITDMHVCPMVTPGTPPVPHVGGPILPPGAPNVLIGSLPSARVGDMAVCVGPPDAIVMGSFTVLIGGKPAARMGDMCSHGGAIVAGMPNVLIGDAGGGGSPPQPGQPSLFSRVLDWVYEAFSINYGDGELSLDLEVGSLWENSDDAAVKLEAGNAEVSFGMDKIKAKVTGLKASKDGKLGSERFGLTGGLSVRALEAEGFVGVDDGAVGGGLGVTAIAGGASVGVNILGYNVSVMGEVGLKWEKAITVGPTTWAKAGPFSLGFSFSKAK